MKTEPSEFSIDDLHKVSSEPWDGIRNYQARNFMRDDMHCKDRVFIYHSSCKHIGVAGLAEVVAEAHPDASQFDPHSKYHDPKSDPEDPRWVCVDVAFVSRFRDVLPLSRLREEPALADMPLLNKSRLSVQPVSADQWRVIMDLARSEGLLD